MRDLRGASLRRWLKLRTAAIPVVFYIAFASGCKTSSDAVAAATQLTATASMLTGYYSALNTLLSETDQLYQIQAAINPLVPYDAQTKNYVTDTALEIQKREKLAAALTTVAQEFAKLSGSTAATDASTAAGNLESAVAGLKNAVFPQLSRFAV
jgi:hypothetical protein